MMRWFLAFRPDRRLLGKPLCEWCRGTATVAIRVADDESPSYACDKHFTVFGGSA